MHCCFLISPPHQRVQHGSTVAPAMGDADAHPMGCGCTLPAPREGKQRDLMVRKRKGGCFPPALLLQIQRSQPQIFSWGWFCSHVGDKFKSCPMEGMMGRMLLPTKPLADLCLATWFLGGGGRLSLLQHFPRQLPGLLQCSDFI